MAKARVGLKDIAELSGVSVGNVSMVLRGLGDKARISASSQERIFKAARQLNYKPNVYAQRLRLQNADKLIIAVFFASSPRVNVMGSFFSGIHELLCGIKQEVKPEVTLHPYVRGKLFEQDHLIHQGCFDGMLCMGMSSEDMDYLESINISAPIVVFNRVSIHHHYVYADNGNVGQIAARVFFKFGVHNVCLVAGQSVTTAGNERQNGFVSECARLGLSLPEEMILHVPPCYEGGFQAAQRLLNAAHLPDAVFFSENEMAVPAQYELLHHSIRIPEQLRIICYSCNDNDFYAIPSLSNIQIPMEEMSRDCLILLQKAIQNSQSGQMYIVHKPILVLGESTGK